MRRDIIFKSQGLRCSGWLYIPDGLSAGERRPAIVMAHGFSAVKEMYLSNFSERFVNADFGDSEGEPRGQFFPYEQIEDYRNAITWVSTLPQVDQDRIGVWGTSKSGGHVLYLAAYDKRVRAVVAQVPSVISPEARRGRDPEKYDKLAALLIQDRVSRYETGLINYIKVVAPDKEPCVLGTPEAYEWLMQASRVAPNWRNQVTVESIEKEREFDPVGPIRLVAPTPLLMISAEHDTLAVPHLVTSAYERALDPKKMLSLPCRHFDVYNTEPWLSKAAGAAIEWLKEYL
jgi:fermentation-respiration switch protein FrsA (DUF1100 family)